MRPTFIFSFLAVKSSIFTEHVRLLLSLGATNPHYIQAAIYIIDIVRFGS